MIEMLQLNKESYITEPVAETGLVKDTNREVTNLQFLRAHLSVDYTSAPLPLLSDEVLA